MGRVSRGAYGWPFRCLGVILITKLVEEMKYNQAQFKKNRELKVGRSGLKMGNTGPFAGKMKRGGKTTYTDPNSSTLGEGNLSYCRGLYKFSSQMGWNLGLGMALGRV
ncbi:unnamed protein product [Dovyalis caffra]|uniref:Uncharacterized protein n=1 Tax=Dovyalis caffra TaxID=77055 RepID=A0AAV1S6F7_9ROSI|nr:unnamed protein product [Dovyalis caffra]